MFDYGAVLASKSVDPTSKPWPGAWAPPMVEAAWHGELYTTLIYQSRCMYINLNLMLSWQGTNLAAYETDFYHNIVSETPEMRQVSLN